MFPNFSALQQSCQWFNQNVVLIGGEGNSDPQPSPHLLHDGGLLVSEPGESPKGWLLSRIDSENPTLRPLGLTGTSLQSAI